MNDLMTNSFLSYVELKKQVQKDLEADLDIETGQLKSIEDKNLSLLFQEVDTIKAKMEEITNPQCQSSTGLRDRMESDMAAVLRKAKIIKARLHGLDQSNIKNRTISEAYKDGTPIDRTRISVTNGMRVKLGHMMNDFQSLRDKILSDHKEDLKRRYYSATGEIPSEEMMEKIISRSLKVESFAGKTEADMDTQVRHEALRDIQRSSKKLRQVFHDMAVLVETQGEKIDEIEENVTQVSNFIYGGTNTLLSASLQRSLLDGTKLTNWLLASNL